MPTLSPLAATAATVPAEAWLPALLEAFAGQTPTQGLPDPLNGERLAARRFLAGFGLPGRRLEAWRFTDTAPITRLAPNPLPLEDAGRSALPAPAVHSWRLPLAPGVALAPADLPEGMELLEASQLQGLLGSALAETGAAHSWSARLNSAIVPRVLGLRIRGTTSTCLELVSHAGSLAGVLPLRLLLVLEAGASLQLLQVHRSLGPSLTSVVLEARLGRGATLQHGLVAQGSDQAALLAVSAVCQEPGSHYSQASVSCGWALARQEPVILQREGDANTRLRGLHAVDRHQIADTHSQVRFAGPDGSLDQLHKVVADGDGRSVFNGSVQVPRPAQRTRASQLSRSLLLSERARVDTKPELEIVADDVRCSHGATISRLRQEELFYLRSRGIAAAEASRLLLRGFCEDVRADLPEAAGVWSPLSFLRPEAR